MMENGSKTQFIPDRWIKCISQEGHIRGVALQATSLIRQMAQIHKLKGIYAQGFGEAVMGAIMIASYCKNRERVNLNIQGSGFFKQALVDAYPDGKVRGYLLARDGEEVQLGSNSRLGPWGEGILSVLRTKNEEHKKPYIGTVPLLTGHLAKDLTFYWVQSEQIPSAVGLVTQCSEDQVLVAGGFLIQALPGASVEEVGMIERHIHEIQSLAESLGEQANPINLLSQIFQSTTFMIVEEKSLEFRCDCSWDRVRRTLVLVGSAELKKMLAEDEAAIVRCDFCAKEYNVDANGLQALIDSTDSALE